MAEKYTGKEQDRRYRGEALDITYSLKRCIHARECVQRLAAVFDTDRRPWINADGAPADETADVIERCPSGALHYERKDGSSAEPVPGENTITLWQDGPLQIHGDLTIQGTTVDIAAETRVTLCRCGASENKPFCDNSHRESGFSAADAVGVGARPAEGEPTGGRLKITAHPDGPLEVEGPFEIRSRGGDVLHTGTHTWLCRCGGSAKKPFCDSTHKRIDFKAE